MDILKFAQEGNVRDNPDYNPKTKKGTVLSPTITDYNPGTSVSDEGRSVLGRTLAKGIYNLNQYDVDKYTPYKIYVNPYDALEDLNKERAKNQGVLEQNGRFLGQAIGSEVIIGSLRAFSDLADAAGRLIGVADDDYTNPVSSQLAEWQDAIRERLEIYRKNPDSNFDFGDTGWWFGNAVSIATALSLFIPGTAISKLGKVLGMGRLARGIGKVAGTPFGRPNTWGKAAEAGSEILGTAAASRIAENYIEARDTYTQVYDEAKERLATMSDEDRELLYKNNPKLRGLDDESIAKYVSGESADDTFVNDMWLMLMDVWQLKGIKNIWKGAKNAATNGALRDANEQAAARLVGRELTKPTGIKKYLRLPDKAGTMAALRQSSEGFEEGWQYGVQQYGIDKGRVMLNDEYQSRTYEDHLADPQMWEQAFWGWLGGIAFENIGSAVTRQWAKHVSKNKDVLQEAREAEINSRAAVIDNYINNMNILNNNLNPNAPILDDNGQVVKNADGTNAYEELSDVERDALKQTETEKLVTDLTINAIDKGNYGLLKDFLNSEDVAQYMDKSGIIEQEEGKEFLANINAKMAEVSELYEGELNKAINNDAKDATIASTIAKENTYSKLASKSEQRIIDGYTTDYNKSLADITDTDVNTKVGELNEAVKLDGIKAEIDYLNNQLEINDSNLKSKKINKLEHDHIARRINKKKEAFIKSANATDETQFNALYNERRNNNALNELNNIDKNIAAAVLGRSMAKRRKTLIDGDIAETNAQIRDRAKYVENIFKVAKDEAFNDTLKRLDDALEANDVNAVVDYLSGNQNVELSDNVKSELDEIGRYLNLFDESSEPFVDVVSRHARIKAKQKGERPVATVNNETVETPPVVAQTEEQFVETEESDTVGASPVALEYLLTNGVGTIESFGYFLHAVAAAFPAVSSQIELIRNNESKELLGNKPNVYNLNNSKVLKDIETIIRNAYGNKGVDIYHKLIENSTGFIPKDGKQLAKRIDELKSISASSTGGQEETPPEIVVPVSEDTADAEIQSILAQQDAIQEKQFNAGSEINAYLLTNFLSNPNEEIVSLDYDGQYAYIKNELINQGYTTEIIDDILPKELSSIRYIYNSIQESLNDEHASSIDIVIGRLMTADESQRADYYRNLIDLYKADNNILSVDGRDYFNIISLMRFAINESNATFETVNKLYNELSAYLISGVDTNLININPQDVALSREKLMELVQDQERENPELDNNMGVGRIDASGRAALASMAVGQPLIPLVKPQGVEFWTILNTAAGTVDVKVGFNSRAKRTADNDGYIFDNGYLTYEIRYNDDGYSSTLDDLFDVLNPQNGQLSDDAKQFIDALYKNKGNQLTQEDIDKFWANPLTKELLNNVKNKNTNNENAIRLLKAIGDIYLYNVSDNLDANYQSYVDWIAKQYNNYKMVDTIADNKDNIKVTVKYISRGEALFNEALVPEDIDKAIVAFNYNDIHLGIVAADGEIHDATNGTVRIKAGFKNRNMVAIVPNGTNEPFYAKIIPQSFDKTKGIGKALRQEVLDSVKERQQGNITFEELRDRLTSIFGMKNFIDGINCIEYNNRIIITTAGSNIPMITIYKFKNDSSEIGTGITLNPTQVSGAGVGRTGWGGNLETELTAAVDKLLDSAVYSMSHGIAQANANNRYVKYGDNGQVNITIGDNTYSYINYLDYIIKNDAGKIKLGKTNINGVPSNFNPTPREDAGKQKVRLEYEVLRPVEDEDVARQKAINAIEQQGNQDNVTTDTIIKSIAPEFATRADKAILDEILPPIVNIDVRNDNSEFAVYSTGSDTVTLFKPFFNLARGSQYKAVRTLAHEQLHRRIFANGIMQSQRFIEDMTTIRDAFIEAINNPDGHPLFAKHIQDSLYDKNNYITQLRKVVDPANYEGKDYNYMLEEFIVESLTNDVLNEALNNIESTVEVSAETKRPNLWQKIINLLRELFGFNQIKDNTLLSQEFKAFGRKFKDIKSVQEKLTQDKVDEQVGEETPEAAPIINEQESTAAELAQNADDTMSLDVDVSDMFSAIDITGSDLVVPNMNAIRAGLTTVERTEFDSSLARGETKIYCI